MSTALFAVMIIFLLQAFIHQSQAAFATYPGTKVALGLYKVPSQGRLMMADEGEVETISLDNLGSDHSNEGQRLARSVAGWLDKEVSCIS